MKPKSSGAQTGREHGRKRGAPRGGSGRREKKSSVQPVPDVGLTEETIRTLSREAILPYLAGLLLLLSGVLVFIVYRSYAWPAFMALLLYVAFESVNVKLRGLFGNRRNLAAASTVLLVIISILGPVALLIRHLIRELIYIIELLRTYPFSEKLFDLGLSFPFLTDSYTSEPFFWIHLAPAYRTELGQYTQLLDADRLGAWLSNAYAFVSGGISLTATMTVNILLGLIILFFLFRDGSVFYQFLEDALPFPRTITRKFTDRMRRILRAVLLGNVFVSFIQGTAVGIGLSICGIPNSIVYGFIAALFSMIPIIGTSVVWLPAALYLIIAQQAYGTGIFLILWGIFFYFALENILKPILLDRKLGLHPLLLFLAILGGITEFGVTGIILGPLFVTLFMTIWTIYHVYDSEKVRGPASASPEDERK